jgi:hypothetical protein
MNPYSYTDKASEFVQEASTLQASMGKQDADDVSIPISHIDGRSHAQNLRPRLDRAGLVLRLCSEHRQLSSL